MAKIYSIDNAINDNKPYVELRGRLYEVRDLTVRERLQKIMNFRDRQKKVEEEKGEDEELSFEDVQEIISDAVQEALVGVPDEVANSITEREWKALQKTIEAVQEDVFPIDVREEEDVDEGKVGARIG